MHKNLSVVSKLYLTTKKLPAVGTAFRKSSDTMSAKFCKKTVWHVYLRIFSFKGEIQLFLFTLSLPKTPFEEHQLSSLGHVTLFLKGCLYTRTANRWPKLPSRMRVPFSPRRKAKGGRYRKLMSPRRTSWPCISIQNVSRYVIADATCTFGTLPGTLVAMKWM